MADKSYDAKVKAWLTEKPNAPKRIWRTILSIWYGKWIGGFRLWDWLKLTFEVALTCSPPFLMHLIYGTITWWQAVGAASLILALRLLILLATKMAESPDKGASSNEQLLITRFTEILETRGHVDLNEQQRDDSIVAALGVIALIARVVTKSRRGEIAVSLATYENGGRDRITIRLRNPGNERPKKAFFTDGVLGHEVCNAGMFPHVLHDIRGLGPKANNSPTNSGLSYRSIIFIPISKTVADPRTPCGFISVDSPRPYAFYGNRNERIVVTCEPFKSHIEALLAGRSE